MRTSSHTKMKSSAPPDSSRPFAKRCKKLAAAARQNSPRWLWSSRSCACAVASVALLVCFSLTGWQWRMVQRKIRAEFPSVRHIRTGELAAWLRDPHRKPPLLLDVRTAEEFNVSHISGAQRVEPVSPDAPDED